jgi:hypothetical protein
MKLNKKAMAMEQLGKYILAIVVLVVTLSLFFIGPGALYSKAQELIPSLTDFIGTENHGTAGMSDSELRDTSIKTFSELAMAMKLMHEDESPVCFYRIPSEDIETMLENYAVKITYENEATKLHMQSKNLESGHFENIQSPAGFARVEGVKPCLVEGQEIAENFYQSWIELTLHLPISINPPDIREISSLQLQKDKLITNEGGSGEEEYDWNTLNDGDYMIYKRTLDTNGESCIAFFPLDTWFGGCGVDNNKLQDDCFKTGEGIYESEKVQRYTWTLEHGCNQEQITG